MKHYAVCSASPRSAAWYIDWPVSGPTTRQDLIGDHPDPFLPVVYSLPCARARHLHWHGNARWVVLEIADEDFTERDGLVAFRKGYVLFNGSPREACDCIRGLGVPVPQWHDYVRVGDNWQDVDAGMYAFAVAGWDATATAGQGGIAFCPAGRAVAGDYGVAVSHFAEVSAGERGYALNVHGRKASAGERGLAVVDEFGEARSGDRGIAIAGMRGTAIASDSGLAVAHSGSHAEAGQDGIAFAWNARGHDYGSASAGEGGVLLIRWNDGGRGRIAVGYVGENGIKANTAYAVDERERFVESAKLADGDRAD